MMGHHCHSWLVDGGGGGWTGGVDVGDDGFPSIGASSILGVGCCWIMGGGCKIL